MSARPMSAPTGYEVLAATLRHWGIGLCAGVTGGGVIHLLKHLPPWSAPSPSRDMLRFFSIGEYAAGFIPLGHFLATGRPAAAIATTGAATKLLACGLSDAKLHDIPAVYIVPVSPSSAEGWGPLQDTSIHGSNIVEQLRAELGGNVFVLDSAKALNGQLLRAGEVVSGGQPVVLVLVDEALRKSQVAPPRQRAKRQVHADGDAVDAFVRALRTRSDRRRIVVLVGEELSRIEGASSLTTRFCEAVASPLIWSINGANGVARDNPYGYGYILFGGNDEATALWRSLGENDVLLVLGAVPDEYTTNLDPVGVHSVFIVTGKESGYGIGSGGFARCVEGASYWLRAPLAEALEAMLERLLEEPLRHRPAAIAPAELNAGPYATASAGHVDLVDLYRRLDAWWPEGSIGFDDVCLAYKDRQYVTQRPNPNIRFHSFYRGSAMGGAFGAAVGASLGAPDAHVFAFTGDGCFRLFAGYLGEARHLGLVVFLLNNGTYAIVEQGLGKILDDVPPERYHADLEKLDYAGIAQACGWDAFRLRADLSNLDELLTRCLSHPQRSILVDIPVDGRQELGKNPRLRNL
ncbi:MAG TPA: thiamine pyrophosphate-dependent enzyme [Luteibacter sp.]|uniref:thiamine pyrophosphate-dependent enzyme n=1 Tax=Luteibacter sp. TaxID=1886636 RepID=UPI002BDCCFC3|nr:thiamine pyrophosphate-dependent enzyme [Luteibacter sp.]HVI56770.1 thiamine pyrophosphate-dependent enzyme [Luteibacter sp.]